MAYTVHNFEQGDVLYTEQLNEMDEQIAANEENINNSVSFDMLAENYSANKTYSIGDYVVYNNELYTCIYEIIAPEGWNSTHWRIANLGDGISDLSRQLSDVDGAVDDINNAIDELCYDDVPSESGSFVQGTIDSSNGIIFEVNPRFDRIANKEFYKVSEIESVSVSDGFQILYGAYSTDDVSGFVSVSSWASSFTSFTSNYVRFAVRRSNGNNITPDTNTGFSIAFKNVPIKNIVTEHSETIETLVTPYNIGSKNQIARLGWNVYSNSTPPEQSIDSYRLAYKNGCKIMLCDVRVTSDGEFVLWHDSTLNYTVRHTDGTTLSDEEKATTINGSTLAELNVYDYGRYKGTEYAGTKIPMLNDFLKWCSLVNCIPMLEIKVQLTEAQCISISNMCKMYGLGNRVIIDEYLTNLNNTVTYWIANLPEATVCIIAGNRTDLVLIRGAQLQQAGIKVLCTLSSYDLTAIQTSGVIDYSKVQAITNTGIDFVYTEITSESELNDFNLNGYLPIFRYISSGYIDVNAWIRENIL